MKVPGSTGSAGSCFSNKNVRFTVLLPVHRPPALLPYAIESVLAQTHGRFDLHVICDGAPAETARCAQRYAALDPRVSVHVFAKGARNGEAHRHRVLSAVDSDLVAHIGDDDLWFPDYLSEAARMLETADFGNLLQAELRRDGSISVPYGTLDDPGLRQRMCETRWNFFGPSAASYRLTAYRALPQGWSPAPEGIWSDLFMWRKFLAQGTLAFSTRPTVQCLKISAADRQDMPLEARARETGIMAGRLADSSYRAQVQGDALGAYCGDMLYRLHSRTRERDERNEAYWKIRHRYDRLTGRKLIPDILRAFDGLGIRLRKTGGH